MKSLDGKKYGRLTVTRTFYKEVSPEVGFKKYCECSCTCGGTIEVLANNLVIGRTTSCGCKRVREFPEGIKFNSRTHTSEYNAWRHMRQRCYDEKSDGYKYYGGRGIEVCSDWLASFENFMLDMGPKPTSKHTIDRIDNNGNYEPSNCRWATPKEQAANRRMSINKISYMGEELSLSDWAERLGVKLSTLKTRYYSGKPVEEVLYNSQPRKPSRDFSRIYITYRGITKSLIEWSSEIGISVDTLASRLDAGWSEDRLISTAPLKRRDSGELIDKEIMYEGVTKTLGEWAKFLGKNYSTIKNRFVNGLPIEQVLSTDELPPGRNDYRGEVSKHIGERYGRLLITGVVKKKCGGSDRSYAICNCDCGIKGKEILLSNIITGRQTSCGCGRGGARPETVVDESKKYSIKNIVGKRFERLVVQEVLKENPAPNKYVYKLRCLCDCGNETIINLTAWGVVKSCGCYRKEVSKENRTAATKEVINKAQQELEAGFEKWPVAYSQYVNQKFNRLTVLEVRQKPTNMGGYKSYAKCLCDCGNITIKFLSNVTRGHTKSCGCAKVDTANAMSYNNSAVVSGSKYCQVGDSFGPYIAKELIKKKSNLYARCSILGGGKEVDIAVGNLSKKGERVRGGSL